MTTMSRRMGNLPWVAPTVGRRSRDYRVFAIRPIAGVACDKRCSKYPLQRNRRGLTLQIVPRRTPLPIDSTFDQTSSHRVLVHVVEFFFRFLLRVQIERIILRLPERIFWRNSAGILRSNTSQHWLQLLARSLLPTFHEPAQLARLLKPNDRMDVVGHHHVARTDPAILGEFLSKQRKKCISQRLAIEHPSSVVARESDKLGVLLLVVDTATSHAASIVTQS